VSLGQWPDLLWDCSRKKLASESLADQEAPLLGWPKPEAWRIVRAMYPAMAK
jgi:hypothetical protein